MLRFTFFILFVFLTTLAFFKIFAYLRGILKTLRNLSDNKMQSAAFNDAVAIELMKIRSDLIKIKTKQDNLGWNKIHTEFLNMFWTCISYPSCFLCSYLKTPNAFSGDADSYQGKIIIILDKDINVNDYLDIQFNAESLIKINATKSHQFTKGTMLPVFIGEADDNYSPYKRYATILSIKENNSSLNREYTITLEISLDTSLDIFNPSYHEKIEKKIIREIEIHDEKCKFFIPDSNGIME